MADLPNIVKDFIKLVEIPSPSGDENEIRGFIINEIKGVCDEIFVDKTGNLLLKIKGKTNKKLLFCAHLDTVKPTGKQTPEIRKRVIYSNKKYVLGADDKVAVASILSYLNELKKDKKPPLTLEVLLTVREETDGGIRDFPKEKITAKTALVMDSAGEIGDVIIAAPFVGGYAINCIGEEKHVKNMDRKTIHPLSFLMKFIDQYPFGRIDDETIVNIAKIRMGENYNSVPGKLYFTGEIRTFNEKKYKKFFSSLRKTIIQLDKKVGTKTKIEFYPYCSGFVLQKSELTVIKKVFETLKIKPRLKTTFGVGDSNILSEWGIRPINISNGVINPHTVDEHVSIESLLLLEGILKKYIELLAKIS